MCARCESIDYPIGDPIWLPCGGADPARYTARRKPYIPGQDDCESTRLITTLRQQLRQAQQVNRRLVAELEAMRAKQPERTVPAVFEAVIVDE